ncbi:bifunctional metallophosphatase/5'-nucleotidase [Ideonella dechloratans]|uniref:Bifunctional metallophosphatase/5'-nucleotidase n=1 Tax=Ideonella dechloratans TaxID=36863 RepID=A0A643FJU8_IDEDE|nr:bifunctional metallophosphatase/5'-nucleotidase [Ideonella dechloratans]KAB0585170.1 bifunctional metallophosphatase/5'-nucleotidase [Ideonella dechloratans]UFU11010.1 bifunctional metallophosphatase/5'-nucleotidase [Ideonella dechloratans]
MFALNRLALALTATLVVCGAHAAAGAKTTIVRASAAQDTGNPVIKVLALNDFHGALESPGTYKANGDAAAVPAGGVDELAGYIAAARAANPNTIVVSAGDLIGASPLVSALFHDEPTIETMNRAGLDFNAVGNHEFDDGKAELKRMAQGGCHPTDTVNSCRGADVGTPVPFEGAQFKFLAANVVNAKTGDTMFKPYGIKAFKAGGKKVKVAFIGLTLKETPQIVTPSGVKGLKFNDEAATVNQLVPELRAQGVEAIVVLIHQGGVQTGSTVDINACAGNLDGSPIKTIVSQLDDAVDLVISGHTHAAYNCQLPVASGRLIPVTSANTQGRVLTDIDITLDRNSGQVAAITAQNKVVDRSNAAIVPNAQIAGIVSAYKALAAPVANQVIGAITTDVPNTKDAACNMPAGDLIADSQWAATSASNLGGAQFALMNPGGVRNPGFLYAGSAAGEGDGNITYGEAFTVQPFGNSLVTLTLTTQQVRDTLEQQFPGCLGQTSTYAKVLLPSNGIRYEWDNTQACGAKVRNLTLTSGAGVQTLVDGSGQVVDAGKTWRVTVNNFLADGGDGFSVLKGGSNRLGGAQDIDALSAYLAAYKAPAPAYNPAAANLGKPRIVRLDAGTSCP